MLPYWRMKPTPCELMIIARLTEGLISN